KYVATLRLYSISVHITSDGTPLSIVMVTLSGSQSDTTTTDANGNYSIPNLQAGGNYTLTPSKANYSFSPTSLAFNNLSGNQTSANFAATPLFGISGSVTGSNGPLSGVTVMLSGSATAAAITDVNGNYSFNSL